MKLIVLTILQSLCTVVGMGLLNVALDGRPIQLREITSALYTLHGMFGVVLLFLSFVLTSVILSFARLSVFIPLNTGFVFLATIIWAILFQEDKISLPMMIGMMLIVAGIALVSSNTLQEVQ